MSIPPYIAGQVVNEVIRFEILQVPQFLESRME